MSHIDRQVIAERMGLVFDRLVSKADIETIRRFLSSPAAQSVANAFQTKFDLNEVAAALNQLRPPERSAAFAFLNRPEVARFMSAVQSPEARAAMSAYGEELMCAHLADTNRTALENARRQGKCAPG